MKGISGNAIRARMERLAEPAVDWIELLADKMRAELEREAGEDETDKFAKEMAAAKLLHKAAADILDRGGVPAMKQVQMESHVHRYESLDKPALLAAIAEKMKELGPAEKEVVLAFQPGIIEILPEETEQ